MAHHNAEDSLTDDQRSAQKMTSWFIALLVVAGIYCGTVILFIL